MEKVACFIDGGYFQKVLKKNFGRPKIDYSKLPEQMKKSEQLLRTYYYDCKCFVGRDPSEDDQRRLLNQEKFFYSLQRFPQFECKFGRLKKYFREDGTTEFVQKQVDVLMTIDLTSLSMNHFITQAKIIAGDSDFIPAVQLAKDNGVVVELFYSPECVDSDLLATVDIATEIDFSWIKEVTID